MNYLLSGTPQTASNCVGGVLYDSGGPTGSYAYADQHILIKPWAHTKTSFEINIEQLELLDASMLFAPSAADFLVDYYLIEYDATAGANKLTIYHNESAISSSIFTGSNFGASTPFDIMDLPATANLISNTSSQVAIAFAANGIAPSVAAGFRLSWTASCDLTGAFFNHDWGSHDPGTRLYPGAIKEINSASSDHVGDGSPVILRNAFVQRNYDKGVLNQLPYFFGHSGPATIRNRFTASITNLNSNYATGSIV